MINIKSKINKADKLDLSPVVSKLGEINTSTEAIKAEIVKVKGLQNIEIEAILELTNTLNARIEELKTDINKGNTDITDKLVSANTKYDSIIQLLSDIKNKPGAEPVDLSGIETHLENVKDSLDSIDAGVKEVIGKLTVTEIKGCYEKQSDAYSNDTENAKGNLAIGFAFSTDGEDVNFKSSGKVFVKKGEVLNKLTLIRRFEDWLQHEGFIGNVNLDVRKDKGVNQSEVVSIFVEGFTYRNSDILAFSSDNRMTSIYVDFIYIYNTVPATLNKYFDKDGNEVVSARKVFVEGKEEIYDDTNFSTDCKDNAETLLESINKNLSDSKDINITRTVCHTKEEKLEYPKNTDGKELSKVRAYAIELKEEDKSLMRDAKEMAITRTIDKIRVVPAEFKPVKLEMLLCSKSYNKMTELVFDTMLRSGKLVYGAKRASSTTLAEIRNISGFENVEGFYEIVGETIKYSNWFMTFYETSDESVAKRGLLTLAGQSNQLGDRKSIQATPFLTQSDKKINTFEYTKYLLETHKNKNGVSIKDVWLTNVNDNLTEVPKPTGFIVGEPSPINYSFEKDKPDSSLDRIINNSIAHTVIDSGSVNSLPKDENGNTLDTLRYYTIADTSSVSDGDFKILYLSLDRSKSFGKVQPLTMIDTDWETAGVSPDFYNWMLLNMGANAFDKFFTADEETLEKVQAIDGFEHVKALYGFEGSVGRPEFFVFVKQDTTARNNTGTMGISAFSVDDLGISDRSINIEYAGYEEEIKPESKAPTYKKYIVETHKDKKGNFIETKWFTNVDDKLTEADVPEGFILGEPSISDIKISGGTNNNAGTTNTNLERIIVKLEEIRSSDSANTKTIEDAIEGLKNSSNANNTDTSNKLTTIVNSLKAIETDNDSIKDLLDEQVVELVDINESLMKLIEMSEPNTLAISIPEAVTYEYDGGDISDDFTVEARDDDEESSYELDPNTNKLLFKGPIGIVMGKYLTVNSTIKYNLKAKVKQLKRDEKTSLTNSRRNGPRYYYGMNSYNKNKTRLLSDNQTSYNYGIVNRKKIDEGDTAEFSGTFGGYNPLKTAPNANEAVNNKFDPFATYAKPIMLFNWYGGAGSETLLESFKIEPVEGTYKTFSGSVTFFFDKDGKEVVAKRIFRKEGKEIPEPEFWSTKINTNNNVKNSTKRYVKKVYTGGDDTLVLKAGTVNKIKVSVLGQGNVFMTYSSDGNNSEPIILGNTGGDGYFTDYVESFNDHPGKVCSQDISLDISPNMLADRVFIETTEIIN